MARRGSAGVTIGDVAREAGVSISTVSRIVNGEYGAAAEETRARIFAAIDQLGYLPNGAARSLKTGRSRMIGVLLADIAHPYWNTVLGGVNDACSRLGYGALVSSAGEDASVEDRYLRMFRSQQVAGLLLNPTQADEETISRWAKLDLPVVMVDRTLPGLPFALVAAENAEGVCAATQHLIALGHRKIGFVSWTLGSYANRRERLAGYLQALREADIEARDENIAFAEVGWQDGVRASLELLGRSDRPTAVVSGNAMLNLQVLAAAKQLGLRVPQDLSVVGFDDSPWDDLVDPPLTTVATPAREIGVVAAELLLESVDQGTSILGVERRLPTRLVIRKSSAPSPG
jgi:DNA-binding LacI/PurR family transcriptional regulator